MSGRYTTLVWIRRQFGCDNRDDRYLKIHPEFEGGPTQRMSRALAAVAKVM